MLEALESNEGFLYVLNDEALEAVEEGAVGLGVVPGGFEA